MNFLQRILRKRKQEQIIVTTRTLAKTMISERIIKVPEVVKNIGLEK